MENKWMETALEMGFSVAASLKPECLQPRREVRDMCMADQCHAYGKNWTCPPYCGTLEACTQRIRRYKQGILLQTVGEMEDSFDVEAMVETETRHLRQFRRFCEKLREAYPEALCLGSGGCRVCGVCAFPEPCRFPEQAYSSMEAYGLLVTQVCQDHGTQYYHGANTITYTACVLI